MRILAIMENICIFVRNRATRAPHALMPVPYLRMSFPHPLFIAQTNALTAHTTSLTRREQNTTLPQRKQQPRQSTSGSPAKPARGEPTITIPLIITTTILATHDKINESHPSAKQHDHNLREESTAIARAIKFHHPSIRIYISPSPSTQRPPSPGQS